jgi:hypothetical protein
MVTVSAVDLKAPGSRDKDANPPSSVHRAANECLRHTVMLFILGITTILLNESTRPHRDDASFLVACKTSRSRDRSPWGLSPTVAAVSTA